MQWDDVQVLLALLRGKNLDGAAALLRLDRSTISRRLAALEQQFGSPLFIRGREGLKPTAVAERLRPHAERMEAEARALAQAATASEDRVTGLVRLATTEAFAAVLVSEGLLDVRRDHPDLTIEILAGNQPVDLMRGEADLAVRPIPLKGATLRARCIARVPTALFAAPDYLRGREPVRSPSDLAGHDVLLPTGELSRLPEAKWLASRNGVRTVFSSNSMPALAAAATAGHGIVALPLGWGASQRALERLFILDMIPTRPVWLVTPEGARNRPAVRVVSDRLATLLRRAFARAP